MKDDIFPPETYTRPFPTYPSEVRVPPQDLDAEQSVLGAMMLDQTVVPKITRICQGEDFYREAHRKVFQAIENLYIQKKPTDLVTLADELKRREEFETVGGVFALTAFVDRVPTSANCEFYAQIVKEKAVSRRLIHRATAIVSDAYADNVPVIELVREAVKLGRATREDVAHLGGGDDSPGTLARRVASMLQESWSNRSKRFVPTGFNVFDRDLGGLERKKFHLITGAPGTGKSSLIQQMSYQMSMRMIPTAYACLDTDAEEIPLRMCCQLVGVDYRDLWSGDFQVLSKERRDMILARLEIFGDFPVRIAGEGEIGRSFDGFAAWAFRAVEEYKAQGIFLDSAAKFKLQTERGQTKEEAITDLVNDLNSLAKELNIPIVTIHELNRSDDPRPKGSGTWEYVARYWYHLERDADDKDLVKLEIRKNNNGPKGFSLKFRNRGSRFYMAEIDTKAPPVAAEDSNDEKRAAGRP